ncbi:MAG: hypothetical protein WBD99_04790 [Thermodesulfobacteriota bacterium]
MRKLYVLAILLILTSLALSAKQAQSQMGYEPETGTTAKERERIKLDVQEVIKEKMPEIKQDPQRLYCAALWNVYYEKEGFEIKVLTRGMHNEVVVFRCPECSLEKEFVDPFLVSEYQGKTGMDRIRECGFLVAIFKGGRGIQEIIKQVQ